LTDRTTLTDEIPLARPVLGASEEAAVVEVLRSGQLSLGPRVPAFEEAFAARLGARHASAVSSGTAACTSRCGRSGCPTATRSSPRRSRSSPARTWSLYERARPVFADIDPRTLNLDPQAAACRRSPTARPRCYPSTSSATRPTCRRFERTGCPIVEDACEALGAVPRRRRRGRRRGHPAVFGFYANKQLTTGEGGMVTLGSDAHKVTIDSERNQGRAPDMGWLDHDRLGFNYRSPISPARSASPSSSGSTTCSPRAPAWPAGTARRWPSSRRARARAAVPDERRRPPRLVRVRRPAPARRRPRRDDPRAARARRAEQAVPARHPPDVVLPRALRPPAGEFPVCEDVAARSVALPFYPELGEEQVARVGEALGRVLG
jgi:perosamine synthetase